MRMSALFGRTLREVPSGTEVAGHGMLLRAGFVRPLAAGVFSYLPLPPGTPYEEQQFAAVMLKTAGALDMPEDEKASLAARIGRRMGG
jgi:prolyl-tRNA synthetase